MTASWLEVQVSKGKRAESLDTHLAVKEEKSSCTMFEVESLDRISFCASSLIFSIPSFLTCQHQGAKCPRETPTIAAKEYIERGEHARFTLVSTSGSLP